MDVVHGWHEVPGHLKHASLAIGTFDGVHRGHRAVLDAAKAVARQGGQRAGAMIFEPYPRKFFQPQKPLFRLTTLPRKLDLFSECGLDFTAVIAFDKALAELSAEEFVRELLVEGYAVSHASVGYNFFFGKGRGGNPGVLSEEGKKYGFGVTAVKAQGIAGDVFSSSRVRELLSDGDVTAAAEMLGSWWRVSGMIVGGAGRGTVMGFPTANIRLEDGITLKHGIYAVNAYLEGRKLQGAAYLGTRPTFDAGAPVLEIFVFDFDGDLYGKILDVEFIGFVRVDMKFRSMETLAVQIQHDCNKAKAILERAEHSPPPWAV